MKKIRPIIKWTGGKYAEFSKFSDYLPKFERYFEPFFGGGGVFFSLQFGGTAFLNDKSKDLIQFYTSLQSPVFKIEMMKYADAWDAITELAGEATSLVMLLYQSFIEENIETGSFHSAIYNLVTSIIANNKTILFEEEFIINTNKFSAQLIASVVDKCKRIKKISNRERRKFTNKELAEHIETAIKSGFYLYVRELTNMQFAGEIQLSTEKAIASWYFVRELCYASMFRYSKKGNFNIPYGGIAYNKKNFRQKVVNVFSTGVETIFSNATFYNLDFENFLNKTKPAKDDFIFVDPPYDSEFSEYDQQVFNKADQQRLRDALLATPSKWMLVIKETDFIRSLYNVPACRFIEFDKTYTYNVRGRNNRQAKHLIIVNY